MVDNQHWLDRWNENRIGFHEDGVNQHLQTWFPRLAPEPGGRVFLPLCGKALDIHWIAQQGYEVVGVELSQLAIEAFLEESGLAFERSESDGFKVYQSSGIRLLQGDFFDLRAHHLDGCKLVYDRAALIAMEQHDRPRYYEHMLSILPASCNMLLITLQYDQAEMRGPPFSVPTDEVIQRYQDALTIETLESENIIDERPRWRKVGLTALQETVFSLNPC
jgi:thiopurine S-methyltransferase